MSDENNQNIGDGVGVKYGDDLKTVQLEKQEEELKQYTRERIDEILNIVMKNPNNKYWEVKYVHASGHGGQKINHGNSKAQLHFNINNFYNDFNIKDKTWEDFVKVVGEKHITHDQSYLILENQETRYALKNKEKLLVYLRNFLSKFFGVEEQKIEREIENIPGKIHSTQMVRDSDLTYQDVE